MDFLLFAKGIFVGFLIAAPVGPVGILCVQRTLNKGFRHGIASGFGAAVADTIFGALAAFGLTFVAHILLENEAVLRLVGGALLIVIGVHAILKRVPPRRKAYNATNLVGDFVTTFGLTISNPITILSFGPVFVAAGAVVASNDLVGAWTLILGVFAGSAFWWLILCSSSWVFRRRISYGSMIWINKISGGVIVAFGVLVLLTLTTFGSELIGATGLEI